MNRPDITAVRQAVHDVRFPAHRWQLIAEADLYGAATATRERLYQLPARLYTDWPDVAEELRTVSSVRPRPRDHAPTQLPPRRPAWSPTRRSA